MKHTTTISQEQIAMNFLSYTPVRAHPPVWPKKWLIHISPSATQIADRTFRIKIIFQKQSFLLIGTYSESKSWNYYEQTTRPYLQSCTLQEVRYFKNGYYHLYSPSRRERIAFEKYTHDQVLLSLETLSTKTHFYK